MAPSTFLLASFVSVSLCFVGSTFAYADSKDGNTLYSRCKKGPENVEFAYCVGYIVGVIDTMDLAQGDKSEILCLPPGVKIGQARDVVEKYLTDHPERRHLPSARLVAEAISKAFPCR